MTRSTTSKRLKPPSMMVALTLHAPRSSPMIGQVLLSPPASSHLTRCRIVVVDDRSRLNGRAHESRTDDAEDLVNADLVGQLVADCQP